MDALTRPGEHLHLLHREVAAVLLGNLDDAVDELGLLFALGLVAGEQRVCGGHCGVLSLGDDVVLRSPASAGPPCGHRRLVVTYSPVRLARRSARQPARGTCRGSASATPAGAGRSADGEDLRVRVRRVGGHRDMAEPCFRDRVRVGPVPAHAAGPSAGIPRTRRGSRRRRARAFRCRGRCSRSDLGDEALRRVPGWNARARPTTRSSRWSRLTRTRFARRSMPSNAPLAIVSRTRRPWYADLGRRVVGDDDELDGPVGELTPMSSARRSSRARRRRGPQLAGRRSWSCSCRFWGAVAAGCRPRRRPASARSTGCPSTVRTGLPCGSLIAL